MRYPVSYFTTNWSGNQTFQAAAIHEPRSLDELRQIVAASTNAKAIGSRHSFNTIADTPGDLISLRAFDEILEIDHRNQTARVGAGIPYGQFCSALHQAGYAVHNMASLPQITLGGACATATHGSGDGNGNLATAITRLTLIKADGSIIELDRDENPDDFRAVVVGLGGFGIIVDLTVELRPTFIVQQHIYDHLPLDSVWESFDEIMATGYSVSLFTTWQEETVEQLWIKQIVGPGQQPAVPSELFGARLAAVTRHPSPGKPDHDCTDQLGAPGPWHDRLPHFRMEAVGPNGDDLQAEYFVDRRHAVDALKVIVEHRDLIAPIIKTSEIRTVAADDLWMSTAYGADTVGIHFSWTSDLPEVMNRLPAIEQLLEPFEPRPHWGKLFTMRPEHIASRYPMFSQFQNTMRRYDPDQKFRNQFLEQYIYNVK
jgi:alditol oxidase